MAQKTDRPFYAGVLGLKGDDLSSTKLENAVKAFCNKSLT
jgi:hypothetical protein